jgi:hypothetical protein
MKLRPDKHIIRRKSGITKKVANGTTEREEGVNLDPYLEMEQNFSQKRTSKRRRMLSEKYPSWGPKTYIVLRSVHVGTWLYDKLAAVSRFQMLSQTF